MIGVLFGKFMLTSIGKRLPPWLWEIIAIALLVGGVWLGAHVWLVRHDDGVRATQKQADDARWNAQLQALAKQAAQIRQKAETLGSAITNQVRTEHEKEDAAIRAVADSQRLRGPGKAGAGPQCNPVVPASSSGHIGAATKQDATGPDLPSTDRAIVSWNWLTNRAEEHDQLLSEVTAWRGWYAKQSAAWAKIRNQPAK